MICIKKYLVLLLISIAFTQCRKDEPIPFCEEFPDQCVEMERIKDHYYFKKDSWWVYEEQNTGAIDSQWVEKSWLNSNNKEFDMVIRSSRHDYDLHRWTHLLTPAKNNDVVEKRKVAYIERSKTKAGDFVGTSFIGLFTPVEGEWIYNSSLSPAFYDNILIIDKIYKEYSVSGVVFENTIKINEEHTITEQNQKTVHYYSEKVGLVRKELLDSNENWLLLKYDVQQ
jgi:hypothetical protein